MTEYFDYRYRFPLSSLTLAADAFTALRTAGLLPPDGLPENMLGDPLVLNGAVVARGRVGRAALSYVDETTGEAVDVPATGDPTMIYVHIRSTVSPHELPAGFYPSAYGLTETTVEESVAVLGVWA